MATFRNSDANPKERFVYHGAGLGGGGGSSYIDDVVLEDSDSAAWTAAGSSTLTVRRHLCQNFYEAGPVKGLRAREVGRSNLLSGPPGRFALVPVPNQLCGNAHSGERSSRRKF